MRNDVVKKIQLDVCRVEDVKDFMDLCMSYDMEFSYDTRSRVMYILYKSLKEGEYAQIFFDEEAGAMTEAYMEWKGEILEFSLKQDFFRVLEEARKDFLQEIYVNCGLERHPRNRYKRKGDFGESMTCLRLAKKNNCMIHYGANMINIETTRSDQPECRIVIAADKGGYKMGALRKRGITINIPDFESMKMILENLES